MEQKLTKELAKKLMEIKGEARGVNLKADWEAVLHKMGKEGLKKLEDKMAELGYPLKYSEIKAMDFYPIGYDVLSILAIKEIFNFDEKQLEEFETSAVRFSIFLKILMKYFFSLRALIKEVPKMWRKHYTVGNLEVAELNEKEKYVVLRLKDFATHPSHCSIFKGYFSKTLELVVGTRVISQETKCIFRGDEYHEFLLKWSGT